MTRIDGVVEGLRFELARATRTHKTTCDELEDAKRENARLIDVAASRERRVNELADFIRDLRLRLTAVVESHDYGISPHLLAAQLLNEMGEAPDWRPGDERGWLS